ERRDDAARVVVVTARDLQIVAETRELLLQLLDFRALVVGRERSAAIDWRRLDPQSDAGGGEAIPRKFLPRILFARRRDVGMREHALAADWMARDDVAAQLDQRIDLRAGKIPIAVFVAGIDDLDPDRAR